MDSLLDPLVLMANFILVPGLAYGCQLALGALGVTMIYAVLNFSNFSHGEIMSFGTMATILTTYGLQAAGVSLVPLPTALLALPVGIVAAVGLCLLIDRFVFRFYRAQNATSVTYLIVSIGVMFVTGGIIRFIIGPNDRSFQDGARFIFSARDFKSWSGLGEGLALKTSQGITILTTMMAVTAIFWFLNRTRTGKSMRAYADNRDLALLSGIDPDRVVRITWIVTAVLATVAGTLYGLDKSYKPMVYLHLVLPIFAAAIVGGVGNPVGAVAGGFIIAFSELFVTFGYKKVAAYLFGAGVFGDGLLQMLSTDYKLAVSFMILVIVLLVKPTGMFGGKTI
ncbi:MAG: branched-chain amino acid ABC transporter permease [Candidatus Puniceispirillum sp.]